MCTAKLASYCIALSAGETLKLSQELMICLQLLCKNLGVVNWRAKKKKSGFLVNTCEGLGVLIIC